MMIVSITRLAAIEAGLEDGLKRGGAAELK
jgi:hypothetical protein